MTSRSLRCGALLLLLAAALSCNRQPAYGIPVEPASEPTATRTMTPDARRMAHAKRLLGMVPARAAGVLLLDPRQVFSLLSDLERALGYTRDGRQFLAWAQALADSGRVSMPWTARQLERLGVDPDRPAMIYAVRREIVALPIKDLAALKARLASVARREPWQRWREEVIDGHRIQICGGRYYRRVACLERDGYLLCARRARHLARALKRVPYRSQWVTLDRADRRALKTAAGYFFFKEKGLRARGTTEVLADGIKARVRVSSSRMSRLLGPPAAATPALVGLAAGARSEFFAHLPLDALLSTMKGLSETLKRAGLDPKRLRGLQPGRRGGQVPPLCQGDEPRQRLQGPHVLRRRHLQRRAVVHPVQTRGHLLWQEHLQRRRGDEVVLRRQGWV